MGYTLPMDMITSAKIDKTAFSVASLTDVTDEKDYWLARTPYERLQALEQMRQIIYGYDPSTLRFQRVLSVTTRTKDSGRYKDLNDLENLEEGLG